MKILWIILEKLGIISCAHNWSKWYCPKGVWMDRKTGKEWEGEDDYQYRDCSKCNVKDKKYI